MDSKFTVAIIGCGSRGVYAYGNEMIKMPDKWDIVALCDCNKNKLTLARERFSVQDENCFLNEEVFFEKRRADVLVIATQDKDHVRMGIRALELGYSVLLEKPISPLKEELKKLLEAKHKYGGTVMVCHVLRYAPAFVRCKKILDSGELGRLIRIETIEQVAYWHQAHSYVRGNWRKEEETSPMIMAKCCHDLDLLQYYAGARGKRVYSTGNLSFFDAENKPDGAADRCAECKYISDCPYSAEHCYVERWKNAGCPKDRWPYNVVQPNVPHTEEKLRRAYQSGPYGRCVFACDNDVVDNQSVSIVFENGVCADLTMTAFTSEAGRRTTFHCTHGELRLVEDEDVLEIMPFGKEKRVLKMADIVAESMNDSFGHGGGDYGIVQGLYQVLTAGEEADTSLEKSVESHLLALAAEESRKTGKTVTLHQYE